MFIETCRCNTLKVPQLLISSGPVKYHILQTIQEAITVLFNWQLLVKLRYTSKNTTSQAPLKIFTFLNQHKERIWLSFHVKTQPHAKANL